MILRELVNLVKFDLDESSLKAAEKRINTAISGLDKFGRRATFMLSAPIAALAAVSIKSAVDLGETKNKFNQVFGELNVEAAQFAEEYSKSVGRFSGDTMEAMAAIQSMSVGLGLANNESFNLSKRIQRLIIDFGSFNNLQDSEAQQRFLSALSGSAEVMDKFGINLKQSALGAELMAMGLGKTAAKATEAEKFLARINIIEKAMTRQGAVGDAVRTLGDLANKARSFFSRLRATMVSFGEMLMPTVSKLLDVGLSLLDWMDRLSESSKRLMLVFAGILFLVGPLALGLAGLLTVVRSLMVFSQFLGGLAGLESAGLMLLQPQFLLIAGAILIAVAALALFIEDVLVWTQGGDSLLGKLLGPWEKWAAGLKEMFSLILTDFSTFVKAMGIAVIDGLTDLSSNLEKTAFGRIVKWISLIKPAEVLADFAGTAAGRIQSIGSGPSGAVRKQLENDAFLGYNKRVRESRVSVSSTINMEVPRGTKEEQISAVRRAAEDAANETFNKQISRLYDNEVKE